MSVTLSHVLTEDFFTVTSNAVISEFQRSYRLTGTYTKVARQLSLSPQHVREVALGKRRSARVMKSLIAEVKRLNKFEAAA